MKSTPSVSKQTIRLILVFLPLLIAAGCIPKYTGPLLFYPEKTESKDYSIKDKSLIFENKDVKITVKQITSGEESSSFVIDDLLGMNFVLIRMEINNLNKKRKILFNPALTSLRDNKGGYRKPLDYTDLYQRSQTEKGFPEDLSDTAKVLYDLTAEVPGGITRSRILVFDQIEEGADRAELVIKNLYIGRESINLTFPFILKPRLPEKTEEGLPIE